jgi:hypothetical protein
MAILNNSNAISTSGGYDINNSLRFRSSASAYLSRTPASNGNRQIWTFSGWVKRGSLAAVRQGVFVANPSGGVYWGLEFDASNALNIYDSNAGGATTLTTTQVFRDPSAWYHIVVGIDTTQATASNRVKLYINGTQVTAFSVANYPTQNSTTQINTGSLAHYIGNWNPSVANLPLDGYLADVNFIDGQQLTPSSFGETDTTTDSWKPKAYTGTYGTNGFYLKFSDIATTSGSNAGLGKDFSGNTNYWTTNNISVTAGTTYDAMIDSPTLTSATVANYCTLNPLRYGTATTATISEANLRIAYAGNASTIIGTMNIPSTGKWYWEAVVPTQTYNFMMVGVIKNQEALANLNAGVGLLSTGYAVYAFNGQKYNNSANSTYMAAPAQNTVVTVAYDADTGSLYVGAGGFWANGSGSTNQAFATASAAYTGITGDISPAVSFDSGNCIVNFGQRPFAYTPPTGYVALNTFNLPTPTILQGNKYMDATLYTGTGTSQAIVNQAQFKPDLVWVKQRNGTQDHYWFDSIRGATVYLTSTSTNGDNTVSNTLTSFNSNGYSGGGNTATNGSALTYVGWQWQAGQGSTSSNTSGSITSTVSVNATAGFSIVTYTGTGANATVGHGLGVAPKMIIVKSRSLGTEHWAVYHTSLGNTQYILLNLTNAASSAANLWNNTTPTSSVFSILTNSSVNTSAATYVAYCWAEIAGFSKFGSYTGNGSADGPFVFTNLLPKFIMIKRTDATGNWIIWDTARNTYNVLGEELYPNLSNAAASSTDLDVLSNGFKLRSTNTAFNASGGTYIYGCFASNPFKNSNGY